MDRRVLLVVAFILTAGGVYNFLSVEPDAPEKPSKAVVAEQATVPVWITARPLVKGALLKNTAITSGALTETQAKSQGLDPKQERLVIPKDARAGVALPAGTVLTPEQIVAPEDRGYIELIIAQGMIPYPLDLDHANGYSQVLSPGDKVDVVMVASQKQNLSESDDVDSFQGLSVSPLLRKKTVLRVDGKQEVAEANTTTVILELSRDDVSRLLLAKRIGIVDLYKSASTPPKQIRTGDVLPDFSSVVELRGSEKIVN